VGEREWFTGEDPKPMLESLRGKASDRKLRLFFCACCRGRRYAVCPEGHAAVETAEAVADGLATERVRSDTERLVQSLLPEDRAWSAYSLIAWSLHEAKGGPYPLDSVMMWAIPSVVEAGLASSEEVVAAIRDLFGPRMFCPLPPIGPSVLQWNNGTVVSLAQAAYEERLMPTGHLDTQRLAVLADALLEAGCDDVELVSHLQHPGPHWRGCFALDRVLGKE
jgi:hypothetical protein